MGLAQWINRNDHPNLLVWGFLFACFFVGFITMFGVERIAAKYKKGHKNLDSFFDFNYTPDPAHPAATTSSK